MVQLAIIVFNKNRGQSTTNSKRCCNCWTSWCWMLLRMPLLWQGVRSNCLARVSHEGMYEPTKMTTNDGVVSACCCRLPYTTPSAIRSSTWVNHNENVNFMNIRMIYCNHVKQLANIFCSTPFCWSLAVIRYRLQNLWNLFFCAID